LADKVFLHVGLPKTGTTYLQSILWGNKGRLRDQGILLPGRSSRHHMWGTLTVRDHPGLENRPEEVAEAWPAIVEQANEGPGTTLISHEFFGGATLEQAGAAIAAFGDAEVHVLVTARDVLTVVTSYWQEYVKHGFVTPLDEFPAESEPWDEWGWSTLDIASVLDRWGAHVPAANVHVLVLPEPDAPRETLWLRFAEVVGIDPEGFVTERARENNSLGLVEAELLRRISPELRGFGSALDRGVWIRSYLAHGKLVPRRGERFLPCDKRVEELRELADRSVAELAAKGYDVVGDAERLRVPPELPQLRHPDDVTEAELLQCATETAALLMSDLRDFRRENTELKREAAAAPPPPPPAPPAPSGLVRGRARLGRVLGRLGRRGALG
jgi:hypothetical protein